MHMVVMLATMNGSQLEAICFKAVCEMLEALCLKSVVLHVISFDAACINSVIHVFAIAAF